MDEYNPTIQALLARCADDWGDPRRNLKDLVPYGIEQLDQATYGIDMGGELVVFQGKEKGRKTTTVANIVANIQNDDAARMRARIAISTLESGMRPQKYRDFLIAIMASRYLFIQGHSPLGYCEHCRGACRELQLSPKFLKFRVRSKYQKEAIDYALATMENWNLLIHGPAIGEGNTRSLKEALAPGGRWDQIRSTYGTNLFVVDNLQQFFWPDNPPDYEKQVRTIGEVSNYVAAHSVVCFMIAQVSLTSVREQRSGVSNRLISAGGTKAAQEANTVFTCSWDPDAETIGIKIEEAREAAGFSVYQRVDPFSGAFFGKSYLASNSEE